MDEPDGHAHRSRRQRSKERRTRRTPRSPRAPEADLTAFAPVPVKPRHDGWTAARQKGFITALAATGSVSRAATRVRLSVSSAYRLRCRPEAESFRRAWDNALDVAISRLSDAAFDRAINGEVVPHYFQGEKVGEHRRFDTRMAMFLLRHRDFGRYAEFIPKLKQVMDAELPAFRLADALQLLAALPEEPPAPESETGAGERVDAAHRPEGEGEAEAEAEGEGAKRAAPKRSEREMRAHPRPPLAGSMLTAEQGRPDSEEVNAEIQRRLAAMRIRNSREVAAEERAAQAAAQGHADAPGEDESPIAAPADAAATRETDPPAVGPHLRELREL